ncbi:MAG: DUF4920 domain-containing protein [Bryobacteraceae bacterium]|nr:DUF4920 domain-containing protein [Bryobacteraceae bacterium]
MLRMFLLLCGTVTLTVAQTRLGQPLTPNDPLTVDKFLGAAPASVGQTVQVTGKIVEVCQMAGCWMQLAGTGKNAVRVKVNDGDIVFPRTSVGKMAIAEGKVQKLELTREQAVKRGKHEAAERNVKFDPASVKSGLTMYQLQGSGALVLD